MIEDGKAGIIERRIIDGREWLTVRTVAGDLFSIVKPDESDEMLETLTMLAREILNAERAKPEGNKEQP